MSDHYKLVFRGEVLDGQHTAVVRKRLAEAAAFDAAALDKLFSGRTVVLKKMADTATAARLQALFRQAGARLRVLPTENDDQPVGATAAPDAGPEVLPAGSDLLRADERSAPPAPDIDVSGITLAPEGARATAPAAAAVPEPDVSHLSLAAVGSVLGRAAAAPEHVVQAPDYDVAASGEDLAPRSAPPVPAVDLETLDFEVAPAGADLGPGEAKTAPAPPDTSHLRLGDGGSEG